MKEKELQRVLKVIELIAIHENPDEKSKPWTDVYMLAHAFNSNATCYRIHENWRSLLPVLEDKLKDV
jgi:hypothetical protein